MEPFYFTDGGENAQLGDDTETMCMLSFALTTPGGVKAETYLGQDSAGHLLTITHYTIIDIAAYEDFKAAFMVGFDDAQGAIDEDSR